MGPSPNPGSGAIAASLTQAIVGQFVATFKDLPPRQKPSSFSIDDIMEALKKPTGG
jgi:arylsulfatase